MAPSVQARYLICSMMDARGLVTYVVTYHQHILLLALFVSSVLTAPFLLFALRGRTPIERASLGLFFFVGVSLLAHVSLSRALGHDAVDVETIRIQATADDAALLPKK